MALLDRFGLLSSAGYTFPMGMQDRDWYQNELRARDRAAKVPPFQRRSAFNPGAVAGPPGDPFGFWAGLVVGVALAVIVGVLVRYLN